VRTFTKQSNLTLVFLKNKIDIL